MTRYQNQHYLPVAYLKSFRSNRDEKRRRKLRIWRDDSLAEMDVKLERQCCEDWAYRKADQNPKESEDGFGRLESDWQSCLKLARSGEGVSAMLTIQQLALHFRNLSARWDLEGGDPFDAVSKSVAVFIEQQILELPQGTRFCDDPNHVLKFPWESRLITFAEELLVTSDNPSVVTSLSLAKRAYGPLVLPVSPSELLVTIDPARIRFRNVSPTPADAEVANFYVARQRRAFVFSSSRYKFRKQMWEAVGKYPVSNQARAHLDGINGRSRAAIALYDPGWLGFSFLEAV